MKSFRSRYGDGPLHAIAVVVSLGFAGYAFLQIARNPAPLSFALFFAGAIVCHDLLAFPVYSLLDRLGRGVAARVGPGPGAINYVRIPAILAAFAFVVWFPLILRLDTERYTADTGATPPDYLGRWLGLTAALFLISGVLYAVRGRRSGRDPDRSTDPLGPRSPH